MTDSPAVLLGYALTGVRLPLGEGLGAPGTIVDALAACGWGAAAVRDHAHHCLDADEPWPHPLPPGALTTGAAQWYAALTAVRAHLDLAVQPQPPSRRTTLTPDERRLLEDRPPHHGPVG